MPGTIEETIRQYVLQQFLPEAKPGELTDSTPLISGGILDSLATLKLVAFLEERFGIEIQPHEASIDYLNTVEQIGKLVRSKAATGREPQAEEGDGSG